MDAAKSVFSFVSGLFSALLIRNTAVHQSPDEDVDRLLDEKGKICLTKAFSDCNKFVIAMSIAVKNETWFDAIQICNLANLCDDEESKKRGSTGFWSCTFNPRQELFCEQWKGHTLGILGDENVGKTWVMSNLASCQLPMEGKFEST